MVSRIIKEREVRRLLGFQELRRKNYPTTGGQIHIMDRQVYQALGRRG